MKFFAIVGVILVILIAASAIYLYSGAYNVAATLPDRGFIAWSLNTIQMSSIRSHAEESAAPPPESSAAEEEGLHHYHEMCVTCHGAPGVEPSEIGKGLNPVPPDLTEVAKEFSRPELYWILENGIKMTGMPAFGPTHREEELWAMVDFVNRLPEITPEEYQHMLASAGLGAEESGHGHSETSESETHRRGTSQR